MDTLVLSASFEPMGRVSWRRAFTLWVADRVEIVEEYVDRIIGTVSGILPIPSIIRFKGSVSKRHRVKVKFSKSNVFIRDGGRCQYCRCRLTREEATYDHVLPRSRGGQTTWKNIVIACRSCNGRKGNRTPEEAGMPLMQEPQRPKKLPVMDSTIQFKQGMPAEWQHYLRA